MSGLEYFVQIHRKEGFTRSDGTYQLTGRTIQEWHLCDSYGAAQKDRDEALKDTRVIKATILTEIIDDFCT